MRIEIVEKIVVVFTTLAIGCVAALVTTFSFIPKESGVAKPEIDADIAVSDWLPQARAAANGQENVGKGAIIADFSNTPATAATPGAKGASPPNANKAKDPTPPR